MPKNKELAQRLWKKLAKCGKEHLVYGMNHSQLAALAKALTDSNRP
jgi:hypothetical protein